MSTSHRTRDLERLIIRLKRLRDQLCVSDPDQAVYFEAAIHSLKVAVTLKGKGGRDKISERTRRLVVGAYREGALTIAEICRTFGISRTSLNKIRKEHRLFKIRSKRTNNQLNMDFK